MPFQMNVASGITAENLDARRVLVDLVEMYCHEILVSSDHEERQALAPHFDYFNKALKDEYEDEPAFGRVHIRRKIAELSLMIGGVAPYAVEEENDDDDTEEVSNMSSKQKDDSIHKSCLEQYGPDDWEEMVKCLYELRNCMIRTDATEFMVPTNISGLSALLPATSYDVSKKTSQRNATPHPVHARKKLFNNRFESLVLMCRVQQSMSHFRPQLETELRRSEEGRDTARISPKDLVQFRDFVLEHFDGEATTDLQEELLSLLKDHGEVKAKGRNTRAHGLSLIPISQAQTVMQESMFRLDYFQNAAHHTLVKWYNAVLKTEPTLTKLGYAKGSFISSSNPIQVEKAVEAEEEARPAKRQHVEDEPEPEEFHGTAENEETQLDFLTPQELEETLVDTRKPSPKVAKRTKDGNQKEGKENISQDTGVHSKEMKKLLAARDTLKNTVVDPLEESRAMAATIPQNVQGTKRTLAQVESEPNKIEKGSFLAKKATATQIAFENSEDEEDDAFMEGENGRATLSEVPERSKVKPQLERVIRRKSPNRQERQYVGQRKKFSQEEKDAIRLGIERFGVGRWAEIKVYYDVELRDRTSVNIKDCYRNMLKRGDL
eukprot:CAMPEP_0198291994 /NCGR_PEP_ID=MMETSP1449-20131203/9299_1 /TAXON_ID=420275 /ORGANISM="Attheya septentrionalis, Strain CCMP2084" /LENGTH=605 /DNA_ID=CAMNT_0043990683 /DNA_START=75 /DNA_END=1895 /DNA_ORIENTATION=+